MMSPKQGLTGALLECINLRHYWFAIARDAENVISYVVAFA